jgi:hypothetical protein
MTFIASPCDSVVYPSDDRRAAVSTNAMQFFVASDLARLRAHSSQNYGAGVVVVVVVVFLSVSTGASVVVVLLVVVVVGAGEAGVMLLVFLEQPTMVVAPNKMRAAKLVDLNMRVLTSYPTIVSTIDGPAKYRAVASHVRSGHWRYRSAMLRVRNSNA